MLSLEKYWNLIHKIDQFESEWSAAPPFALSCHPGCDECCRNRFTLFAVEVAAIAHALRKNDAIRPIAQNARSNGLCPFLDGKGKTCTIYQVRPIICRTQGFPFVYVDENGQLTSDICTHNRRQGEVSLPAKYVLNLETLNRCLSSLNYLFLAEMEEEGVIIPTRLDIGQILDYFKEGEEE